MMTILEGNHEMRTEELLKHFEEYFGTPIQRRIEDFVTNGLGYENKKLLEAQNAFGYFNSEENLKDHLMIMNMRTGTSYKPLSQEANGTSSLYFSERSSRYTPAARAFAEDRRNSYEQIHKLLRRM